MTPEEANKDFIVRSGIQDLTEEEAAQLDKYLRLKFKVMIESSGRPCRCQTCLDYMNGK